MKIATHEMGQIRLELIDEEPTGQWEAEWEPLRGTVFGAQFAVLSRETLNHGLHRWSRPLVQALGIPPAGALKKIPVKSRQCFRRDKCPLYNSKQCFPEASNMPWCFEPDGVEPENVRLTASRAIEKWREGSYLVIIKS